MCVNVLLGSERKFNVGIFVSTTLLTPLLASLLRDGEWYRLMFSSLFVQVHSAYSLNRSEDSRWCDLSCATNTFTTAPSLPPFSIITLERTDKHTESIV